MTKTVYLPGLKYINCELRQVSNKGERVFNAVGNRSKTYIVQKTSIIVNFGTNSLNYFLVWRVYSNITCV